ncbi:MAG: hypothetical protein NVSMB39_2970 [Candidatus Saccharimonadales bacterium]
MKYYDRRWFTRTMEILPGAVTWLTLLLPIVLSLWLPVWVAYFIIAYDLYWMVKSFRLSVNLVRGYRQLHLSQKIDWNVKLRELGNGNAEQNIMDPNAVYHAIVLATYNESIDILHPSVESLTQVDYPLDHIFLIIAYEERGGAETKENAEKLVAEFGGKFGMAMAVMHPDGIKGEVRGKGGNISYAGRVLAADTARRGLHPAHVVVTPVASDHRSATNYFSYLTYEYAKEPNRLRKSFQPIPMFYNNIWDVPAPMRVIATGNSFWLLMETMRPHRLRNFAAHAQSLAALIATDFWSVTSIVEDGHQYWRSYFAFNGDHEVVPIFTPVFQDAVLANTYLKTFKVQFLQLRRWAWGVSDFPYVVRNSLANKRIPWRNKRVQIMRLFESHFSWATAPLLLTFVGGMPLFLNHNFAHQALAYNLPVITSRILAFASLSIGVTVLMSLISLPPRPERYRRTRHIGMLLQWILLPVVGICFSSMAALNSQTRLMLGKYLEFYVTEKATKNQ